jgi:glycosyltransferase involved in cell wall biosynthesis
MKPSVSIIIPVFNAEATLGETLQSVALEVSADRTILWSIIAIDDGSTDSSAEILFSWTSKLPLKILNSNHSGGPAIPRNLGIAESNSDYVFFLDSDDVLLPGGLTATVHFAVENNSDVVLPRLKSLDGRGVPRGMFGENLAEIKLTDSRIYWALNPMKLIRRSILTDDSIRFDTSLRRDEDQPFSFKVYLAASKISILSNPPVVGVRYSPEGTNLTMRAYKPEDCFEFLNSMVAIMDSGVPDPGERNFLMIRHWEIEIARELFWQRLALLPESDWIRTIDWLLNFSKSHLVPDMLPRTSIRWRGIVGLIGSSKTDDLVKLLKARRDVLQDKSPVKKYLGIINSNWIRLKSTLRLPVAF